MENNILQLEKVQVTNYRSDVTRDKSYNEIIEGLLADKKYISSKYFYNKRGSELFEEITRLDEYYPTRTEISILNKLAPEVFANLRNTDIIELGSGDCSKISILLNAINQFSGITYVPVDISKSAVFKSANILSDRFPELSIDMVVADFLQQYEYLNRTKPQIVCFLGSTIGNLSKPQAQKFIKSVAKTMKPGDKLLLGLDRVKDIHVLESAYNDSKGVTAAFNKNILNTVNSLTGANFFEQDFEHVSFYNSDEDRIEMHLKAKRDLQISICESKLIINIAKGETIHTENSHKYNQQSINKLIADSQLHLKEIFTDNKAYFSLCLFEKL